jgi:predicted amidohydrolase YtcJ
VGIVKGPLIVLLATGVVAGQSTFQSPPAQSADLIVVNGKVYPGDGKGVFHEAVAARGGTIIAIGRSADIERLRSERTQVIDARGGAVMPGFDDPHAHIISGGLAKDDVDLGGARTLDEIQNRIRSFAARYPDRSWVRGRGWAYEPFPGELPTREILDALVPDRPAAMRCYDGHSLWVNSRALALAGITRETPDPPNGTIVRDARTGEPTGLLKETPAMALVNTLIPPPSEADRRRALSAAIAEANRFGVTSLTDASGNVNDFRLIEAARRAGEMNARVYYSLLVSPGFTAAQMDQYDAVWKAHPDTPFLKTGLIKLFLDGVIETNTAYLLAPYTNVPTTGTPNYSREEFAATVQAFDRRGWQIAVHAIGDGAVRMALDTFERAAKTSPPPARGRRHRLEHVETLDLADVPRFGALGVIASMHPIGGFLPPAVADPSSAGGGSVGAWARNLGPDRAARGGLWKSIIDTGGRVVIGSDWPVASLDAMARITTVVNRRPRRGVPDQRLAITQAVDTYTRHAAYAAFEESRRGTLAPGMAADLVVLATDVFSRPPAERAHIAVTTTIVDGRVVYRAAAATATGSDDDRAGRFGLTASLRREQER